MKKLLRKSLIMTLAAVLLIGTFAISADAVMKKTIKPQEYTKKVSVANKKAAVVKKGTTKLTFKEGYGYIKFVAPATKTYKFTFSNLKQSKNVENPDYYVGFSVQVKSAKYPKKLIAKKVSTMGGKASSLKMYVNDYSPEFCPDKKVDWYEKTRTGKVKLKKGQAIYFWLDGCDKITGKLVIK
ncbi:MAG: hypothetical protein Q4F25_06390 [Eubacteriales bacterium]|nr:hypothetical protein [Eubacteriales bacterium]